MTKTATTMPPPKTTTTTISSTNGQQHPNKNDIIINNNIDKRIDPSVPGLTKQSPKILSKLWKISILVYLFCIGNLSFFLGAIWIVSFIPLFVSLRDMIMFYLLPITAESNLSVVKQLHNKKQYQRHHYPSVEYNYCTILLSGIIVYSTALYILSKPITFVSLYRHHKPEYCALAMIVGYQMIELQLVFKYCRPVPNNNPQSNANVYDYLAIPFSLFCMALYENTTIPFTIFSPYVGTIYLTKVITALVSYKLVRLISIYYETSKLKIETTPLHHPRHYYSNNNKKKDARSIDDSKINPLSKQQEPNNKYIWNIYGKQYDMMNFVTKHPGGMEAIMLGANRDDCTGLFQAYHPFTIQMAESILHKYEIRSTTEEINNHNNHNNSNNEQQHTDVVNNHNHNNMDQKVMKKNDDNNDNNNNNNNNKVIIQHKNDVFYSILCDRVGIVLQQAGIDPIRDRTPNTIRYIYYIFLVLSLITTGIAHCKGSLLGSFLFGVVGWFMGAIGHDGGHYAVSHNPFVNDIAVWGMSMIVNPILWQHQHTYAHHIYTNEIDKDPDLHHFDLLLRYHKQFVPKSNYQQQVKKIFVLFCWTFTCYGECYHIPLHFILDRSMYTTVNWSDRERLSRTMLLFFHMTAYFGIVHLVPFFVYENSWKAFLAAITPLVTTSLLFAFCSQVGHINEACVSSKIRNDQSTTTKQNTKNQRRHPDAQNSWAADQVESTNNFAPQSAMMHFLANGLSLQIEHHLFPGINHCHLMKIQPIVEQTCKEYGVNYVKHESFRDIIGTMFDYLTKLAVE